MKIHKMQNSIRNYPWGGTAAIPALLGIANPEHKPFAELWMGAHPSGSSIIEVSGKKIGLDTLIATDPESTIGRDALRIHGPCLPFLMKFISAASPLSIQAHPNRRKAEEGFEREEISGIPLSAPERCYRDREEKTELVVAIDGLELLYGFRPIEQIVKNIKLCAPGDGSLWIERLDKERDRIELSVFIYSLLNRSNPDRRKELSASPARIAQLAQDHPDSETRNAFAWTSRLLKLFPDDPGVFAPLFLNLIELAPGEALRIAPGEMHSYLHGFCLEISTNSDNIIRGGLTHKYVDSSELLALLSFNTAKTKGFTAEEREKGISIFPVSINDIHLMRLKSMKDAALRMPMQGGPEILFAMEGLASISSRSGKCLDLRSGESAFIEAGDDCYTVSGDATLFRAFCQAGEDGKAQA